MSTEEAESWDNIRDSVSDDPAVVRRALVRIRSRSLMNASDLAVSRIPLQRECLPPRVGVLRMLIRYLFGL